MAPQVPSALLRNSLEFPLSAGAGNAPAPSPGVVRFAGFSLASHFQPIYSLPHRRLVGHEALLRATGPDGLPVPPVTVFKACSDEQQLSDCDRLSRLVHLESYAAQFANRGGQSAPEWLFLNVHPLAFQRLAQEGGDGQLRELLHQYAMRDGALVLEVLEAETADPARLAASIAIAREAGLLIAIDDFGAGHSNFDRVWRMRPDIVKVDRSLVARAACDASACRILRRMVSLIHECGAMVLIEGVETCAEARVAIDCDAEMVQGYLFGRPDPVLRPPRDAPPTLRCLPAELAELRAQRHSHQGDRGLPFRRAMSELVAHLAGAEIVDLDSGVANAPEARRFVEATRAFLGLPGAEACFLLDADGLQLGPNLFAGGIMRSGHPMADPSGACWTQRPYFIRAIENPGQAQVSRPYRNLGASHLCATVAVAFPVIIDGLPGLRVACGDFRWED